MDEERKSVEFEEAGESDNFSHLLGDAPNEKLKVNAGFG